MTCWLRRHEWTVAPDYSLPAAQLCFFFAAPFFLAAAAVRLGLLTGAFTFARADFLFGLGNIGFETVSAADFCSPGPAASSFAPPLLTASTTDSTTTWVAAAAAAPNAVPATV
jgi:hypothetical protein